MTTKKDCNCPEEIEEMAVSSNEENTDSQPNLMEEDFQNSDVSNEPQEVPTSDEESQEEAFGAGTWYDGKKITGLWSKNETRNSWAAIPGMGWKKLNNSNNSSCLALTILASHAKQYNRNTKFKIDNNQIKEMYVW